MFIKRLLLLLAMLTVAAHLCFAHPMGNFSVNHYTRITLQQDGIEVRYFIDLAEIPTYQELQQYNFTPEVASAITRYLVQRGNELVGGLILQVDGTSLPLHMVSKAVIFPPGAGGLPTMKLGYTFHTAYPHVNGTGAHAVTYADNNYPGHAGWKEIIVEGPSSLLLASSAPRKDRSAELSNYPTDMLNSPPQELTATLRISTPSATPVDAAAHAGTAVLAPVRGVDAAKPIVAAPRDQVPASLHRHKRVLPHSAAGPVHVAALPLISAQPVPAQPMHLEANRQGTARDHFTELITAQRMSAWFLLTAAFVSMGLGSLHALEPGHGKTIVAAYLVGSRGTARHALLLGLIVTAAHTVSVFALGAITLCASHYILPEQLYPWLGVMSGITIAALGGYMFLRRWTGEEAEHAHTAGEMHGHWFSSRKNRPEAETAASTVGPTKSVSLFQLFTLGVTGGIIPCPAALVVLLSALALHRINFGFFLIVCFSIGLAAVLIGFGLLMVYARRFVSRLQLDGPWTKRWLPVASAGFMTILGTVIAIRAFATTGLSMHSFSQQKLGPALFVAGVGLVLGIRHSTDTDHVVAISTIVTKQRGLRGAALIGGLWGLGHTLTIFVAGCLIILCGVIIPPRVGLSMEFSVGLMLILLGFFNLSGLMQKIVVRFKRSSGSSVGAVITYLAPETKSNDSSSPVRRTMIRSYGAYQCLRPLVIGLVHGLAGSAAVALLVLSTIRNPIWAIVYLIIFGTGTMLGMMCMTMAMSMPLMYAGERMPRLSRYLSTASGIVSVCFGTFLVYQLGFVGGLFTRHPHWTPH
jgi:nickel/cobalt exporter